MIDDYVGDIRKLHQPRSVLRVDLPSLTPVEGNAVSSMKHVDTPSATVPIQVKASQGNE